MDAEDKVHLEKSLAYAKAIDDATRGEKAPDGRFRVKHIKNMTPDSIQHIALAARSIVGRLSQVIEKEAKNGR